MAYAVRIYDICSQKQILSFLCSSYCQQIVDVKHGLDANKMNWLPEETMWLNAVFLSKPKLSSTKENQSQEDAARSHRPFMSMH